MKLEVIQQGKLNRKFVVTNPKKIKFWKRIASEVSPFSTLVVTEVREIK